MWGGIFNPIIPVSKDGKSAQKLINHFSVDTLVPISHTTEIKKIIADNVFMRLPHVHEDIIFHQDWHSKKNDLYYLDSLNIIDFYWGKEYKNTPKDLRSHFGLISWDKDDVLANIFTLQFGQYPTQAEYNLLYDFEKSFIAGLRAHELTIIKDTPPVPEIGKRTSPIDLTSAELVSNGSWRPYSSSGIYVGDENSFVDLVSFWNLRATGYQPLFLPKTHLERFRSIAQAPLKKT